MFGDSGQRMTCSEGLVASLTSTSTSTEDDSAVPAEVWQEIENTLRLLTWSSWLISGAAAVSGLVLVLLRRKEGMMGATGG